MRCRKHFTCSIFVVLINHEIFLTTKTSKFAVPCSTLILTTVVTEAPKCGLNATYCMFVLRWLPKKLE